MGENRTYGQRCGLALSLDLLGERWTLLVIRELARGPKRFGDLQSGLNGIGTNLLSARLKSLAAEGIVEKVELPPPASATAYALTDRGRSLQPILEDLAVWGYGMIGTFGQQPDLETRAAWAAMTMKVFMDRADAAPPVGIYGFRVGEEAFWLRVTADGSELLDGRSPVRPDVDAEMDTDSFFALATGATGLKDSSAVINGDREKLEKLIRTFRLPLPAGDTNP